MEILIVVIAVIAVAAALAGAVALANYIAFKNKLKLISSIDSVEYKNQLKPSVDENGFSVFTTDDDMKIVQLTDIHIGGGCASSKKDLKAMACVASMLQEEKPDFVIVTGDIAYPIPAPFSAMTFNNKYAAKEFAELMEKLGVYWTLTFGNHDTEAFAFYNRSQIGDFYENSGYKYCLFKSGPNEVDGSGNHVVNIKNSKGDITQSLIMIDSNSYVSASKVFSYDNIHENQISWYKNTVLDLKKINGGKNVSSLCFYHIPNMEFKTAWDEYVANGMKDTENVKYVYGVLGEKGGAICCGKEKDEFFSTALQLGSTKGIFVGHDHVNTFSLFYKGIRLTYGLSVDYLAYIGIDKYGIQRGCTVITSRPDSSFDCYQENYYQDKYKLKGFEKESVYLDKNFNQALDK